MSSITSPPAHDRKRNMSFINRLKGITVKKTVVHNPNKKNLLQFHYFDDFTEICERYGDVCSSAIIENERKRWREHGRFSPFIILQGLHREGKLGVEFLKYEHVLEKSEMSERLEKMLNVA
jgi:hypothetical protein